MAESSRAGDVARVVGGLVVVGVVVAIALWAERATDDDLELPDRVVGWSTDDSAQVRAFVETNDERLSEAYDGADAATAVYAGDLRVLVTAVRAAGGPPVPALLGDDQRWVEDDDVTCLVTDPPKGDRSALCQRDDGELTVRAYAEGTTDVDTLVGITNDVWDEVS
jgi:hypothetical protein